MTDRPVPQVSARIALRDMLPVLLGQAYLIGLVASGHLDYLQATVGIMAEMLIGLLMSISFLSPNMKTLANRTWELVIVILMLAMFLVVVIYLPHDRQAQQRNDEMALKSLADIKHYLPAMLGYLFGVFGLSVLLAKRSGNAAFWWYRNITSMQVGITCSALFLGIFISAPVGMFVSYMKFPVAVYGIAWIVIIALLRLTLIFVVTRYLSGKDWETEYRKYVTGETA